MYIYCAADIKNNAQILIYLVQPKLSNMLKNECLKSFQKSTTIFKSSLNCYFSPCRNMLRHELRIKMDRPAMYGN